MLSAKRDVHTAKRLFLKVLKSSHSSAPRVINVDKNPSYPTAMHELKEEEILYETCQLRQVKYLNNIVEQDHRFIKRLVRPGLGFSSFHTAWKTLRGYRNDAHDSKRAN